MTQAERTALSDRRMCAAAIDLILEGGAHRTTLKDVGKRAGYSRGLASSRFGSKEALFSHLVAQFNQRWNAELARHVGGRTGLAAFLGAIEAVESFIVEESKQTRAMYILWYESISSHSDVRARHAEHHETLRRDARLWIEQGIREQSVRPAICPEDIAVQYCSFIFGTVYQWLVSPDSIDLHRAFASFRESVVDLIGTERYRTENSRAASGRSAA